jgi:hypothetical protein
VAECAHCHGEFVRRRSDHRFCCPEHRKLGERKPGAPALPDREQIARLFDKTRDPDERVRADDWHPSGDPRWHELDAWDTVGRRRHWYEELALLGRL